MATRILGIAVLVAGTAVAGCRAGEDDAGGGNAICQVVGNGSVVSASSNPSGTFDNPTLAFDGHLESYAELSPAASANGTISGGGLSRPAGEFAGIAFARPGSGAITVQITTYSNGAPVSSGQAGSTNYTPTGSQSTCPGYCLERNGQVFYGIQTQLGYDAIEAAISISGFAQPLRILELCVVP